MHSTFARGSALFAAGALMLVAGAAAAQDYDDGYRNGPDETVTVTAPYHAPTTDNSSLAPTSYTHLSVQVRYDDLDLRTREGARELKERVRDAARDVCEELQDRFPIAMSDSPPCYHKAVEGGMARADNAISDARRYEY